MEEESLQTHQVVTTTPHFAWILNPIVAIVFVISSFGSCFIFCLVCLSTTFRRTSNYLIANLCVASVYHIGVSMFYHLQSGGIITLDPNYGKASCEILAFVHRLSTPVLPLTIAAISLDRSTVARNPMDYPSQCQAISRVIFIWTFSAVLLIPRSSMSMFDDNIKGFFKCKKVLLWNSVFLHTAYAVLTLIIIYIIPTYILIKEYFAMRCQMRFLMTSQVEQRKRFQRRVRVMKNACFFTIMFISLWLPLGIFQLPFDLPEEYFLSSNTTQLLVYPRDFFRQLSIFNTCLTPIILLVLSFDIREFISSCYV